jgi:hypothetical protein
MKLIKIELIRDKQDKILLSDYCIHCPNIATHKAFYQIEGAVKIERYCFKHIPIIARSQEK